MATDKRTGPLLRVEGSCEGCAYARGGETHWTRCEHPSLNTVECFPIGEPTPAWCPELPAARLALLVDLARTLCRKCGRTVEPERECYAIPTCFACLPPPPRLPLHTFGAIDESALRTMMVGDMLSEPTATPGEHVTVELGDGGWLVRLGTGDVSLAGTSKLAMRYVKDRRKRAASAADNGAARGAGEESA